MSARSVLAAAARARLRGIGMTVHDAPPVRAGVPFALVEPPTLADWSGVGWQGREGRLTVTLHDEGERPVRLEAAADGVEAAVETIGPELVEGWRLLTCRAARIRRQKNGDRWTATLEFAVRMARVQ